MEICNLEKNINDVVTSPRQSSSEISSVTDTSMIVKNEEVDYSSEYFPQIDDSFWSEELPDKDADCLRMETHEEDIMEFPLMESVDHSRNEDSMDFWYNLFIRGGDMPDLPEF